MLTTKIAFLICLATGVAALWSLFLLPSLVAFQRRHLQRWAVFGLNLLLGATGGTPVRVADRVARL
ncbi:superinfection immunity protein [Lichenibacterium dinghuense]|uniref:superinfection immunity protein n=1 Tax=Lichenibacterium dinghuense TaxID=2895977 RepID=UPI003D1712F4